MANESIVGKNRNFKDLTGKAFGRWTVVRCIAVSPTIWECRCECGTTGKVRYSNLTSGSAKSCGCHQKNGPNEKHGLSKTPEYRIWLGIKARCRIPSATNYEFYGGRGIDICNEWFKSFTAFIEYVGLRPSLKHSIDRIDNNSNYEPGNVRWATKKEQDNNKRNSLSFEWNGKLVTAADAAEMIGIHPQVMRYRIHKWGIDRAMTTPANPRRRQGALNAWKTRLGTIILIVGVFTMAAYANSQSRPGTRSGGSFSPQLFGQLPFNPNSQTAGGLSNGQSQSNYTANLGLLQSGQYGGQAAHTALLNSGGYWGGGNSGNTGSSGGNFLSEWERAYKTARDANEKRYGDIRDQYSNLHARQQADYKNRQSDVMDLINQYGGQQKADVNQRYDQLSAKNQQDLTSRGLTGTTILPTMKMGNERERSDALNRVDQNLLAQRASSLGALSGDTLASDYATTNNKLGFMERRTDAYPDQNLYAQLSQKYGQSGGGYNGGGYGGGVMGVDIQGMGGGGGYGYPQYGGWGGGQMPYYGGLGFRPYNGRGDSSYNSSLLDSVPRGGGGDAIDPFVGEDIPWMRDGGGDSFDPSYNYAGDWNVPSPSGSSIPPMYNGWAPDSQMSVETKYPNGTLYDPYWSSSWGAKQTDGGPVQGAGGQEAEWAQYYKDLDEYNRQTTPPTATRPPQGVSGLTRPNHNPKPYRDPMLPSGITPYGSDFLYYSNPLNWF